MSALFVLVDRSLLFIPLCVSAWISLLHFGILESFALKIARIHMVKRRNSSWEFLCYLLGYDSCYNPFVSSWWRQHGGEVAIAVSTMGAALVAYQRYIMKDVEDSKRTALRRSWEDRIERVIGVPLTEAHSNFSLPGPAAVSLTEAEELLGCGNSYERVPVKGTQVWNARQLTHVPMPHTGTLASLERKVARNVRNTSLVTTMPNGDVTKVHTHVFGLCSDYALINTHALGKSECPEVRVSNTGIVRDDAHGYKVCRISALDRHDLGNDLTIVRLKGMHFVDVRVHISIDDFEEAMYTSSICGRDVRAALKRGPSALSDRIVGDFEVHDLWCYTLQEHYPGLCGVPLFVQKGNSFCVAGIHEGGRDLSGFALVLDMGRIQVGMDVLKKKNGLMHIMSEGPITAQALVAPVEKSPFRYEVLHGVEYFGKEEGPILINKKSRLQRSRLSHAAQKAFYDKLGFIPQMEFGRPQMTPLNKKGKFVSPYNIALKNISAQRAPLDTVILNKVVDEYSKHIIAGLKAKGVPDLSPLTAEAAINGVIGDAYTRRVNVTTAAGHGYPGKKAKYLPVVIEDLDSLVREPVEELKAKLCDLLHSYARGETTSAVYVAQLKDEPRDIKKVEEGKTRVFYASGIDSLVLSRMLLAPFYTLMAEHGDVFGCAIGVNMHSGAGKVVNDLTAFSKFLMEGDYSHFDQSMPYDVGLAAATVVLKVLEAFGYNLDALLAANGVLSDTLQAIVSMCLDIFKAAGIQPSGKFATAEDNSLRGVILLMYFWYATEALKDKDFFKYVLPKVYGDDLLAAVKEAVARFFNNLTYQKFCEETFMLGFTSAQKDGRLSEFVDIHTCSFLKRKFVYREDIDMWVAPLDLHSVLKSLCWLIPSSYVSPYDQMESTVHSALWELAFHCSPEVYEDISSTLVDAFSQEYGSGMKVEFPMFWDIISAVKA
jgi:hypothetical protein